MPHKRRSYHHLRKTIVFLIIITIVSQLAYSQEDQIKRREIPEYILYLTGGTIISTLGVGNGVIVNGGYEGFVLDILSAYGEINAWIMNDTFIAGSFGINVHPFPKFKIDPFIGVGVMYGTWMSMNMRTIDVPLNVGANLMIADFFGFRMQAKVYLLSLAYAFTEINAGLLLRF
jgi:hypothetical protein